MLKTIEEVAKQLGVSKSTIYNKIKLNRFKDSVVISQGQSMLQEESIQAIRDDIKGNCKSNTDGKSDVNDKSPESTGDAQNASDAIVSSDYIQLNREYIKTLEKQIIEKDAQLSKFDARLKESLELNRNNQILLKDKPQENLLLLEEHFQELDTKLEEVKENMQQRKTQQSKGLFSKLFKK